MAVIGKKVATDLFKNGKKALGERINVSGMIYKVVADETFADETWKIATTLAAMPTKGLAYTKLVLNNSIINSWEEQLQDEDIFQQRCARTDDFKEGVQSFIEKRQPTFKGK